MLTEEFDIWLHAVRKCLVHHNHEEAKALLTILQQKIEVNDPDGIFTKAVHNWQKTVQNLREIEQQQRMIYQSWLTRTSAKVTNINKILTIIATSHNHNNLFAHDITRFATLLMQLLEDIIADTEGLQRGTNVQLEAAKLMLEALNLNDNACNKAYFNADEYKKFINNAEQELHTPLESMRGKLRRLLKHNLLSAPDVNLPLLESHFDKAQKMLRHLPTYVAHPQNMTPRESLAKSILLFPVRVITGLLACVGLLITNFGIQFNNAINGLFNLISRLFAYKPETRYNDVQNAALQEVNNCTKQIITHNALTLESEQTTESSYETRLDDRVFI